MIDVVRLSNSSREQGVAARQGGGRLPGLQVGCRGGCVERAFLTFSLHTSERRRRRSLVRSRPASSRLRHRR